MHTKPLPDLSYLLEQRGRYLCMHSLVYIYLTFTTTNGQNLGWWVAQCTCTFEIMDCESFCAL